jgi:hypothetical protein
LAVLTVLIAALPLFLLLLLSTGAPLAAQR